MLNPKMITRAVVNARSKLRLIPEDQPLPSPKGWEYVDGGAMTNDDDHGMTEAKALELALGMSITYGDGES